MKRSYPKRRSNNKKRSVTLKEIKNLIRSEIKNLKESVQPTNEIVGAAAGFVALVSAAGGMAALQMKMENPEERKKHPKLAALLDILGEMGSAASSAKLKEQEEEGEGEKEVDLSKLEDELGNVFDADCEVPSKDEE
tara:strand:- start:603 stop:1013 length:411 start_codon:yes stop_codon:yes gene_type:complete